MKRKVNTMSLMKKAGICSLKILMNILLVIGAAGSRLLAGILSCLGIVGILIGADMKEMAVFFLLAFALVLTTELNDRLK